MDKFSMMTRSTMTLAVSCCAAGLLLAGSASANTAARPMREADDYRPLGRCDQNRDYMAAKKFFGLALISRDKRDFSGTNSFANIGLDRINSFVAAETVGREKRLPRRIDDSVAALADAQQAVKNHQLEYAALMKVGILDERIQTYGPGVLCK